MRDCFEGPLTGRRTVSRSELLDGAIRVDQYEEDISNGMGGLTKVTRTKRVYFDLEPTPAALSTGAFAAAARIVGQWATEHPAACLAPLVLHLTRGAGSAAELEQAIAPLASVSTAAGPVTLYHWVATESPHKSLLYPDTDAEMAGESLKKLWQLSSPLLGRVRLSGEKPLIKADSRGMVINGRFDVLLDEVKRVMAG